MDWGRQRHAGRHPAAIPSRLTDNKILLAREIRPRPIGCTSSAARLLVRAWLDGDWSALPYCSTHARKPRGFGKADDEHGSQAIRPSLTLHRSGAPPG
jgi:hypothetical protein